MDAALDDRAPAVFDEVGHNLMFEGHWTYGDPDGQFASAARTNRWRFTQHRQCNAPLEGRAGLVDHDPDSGDLTYHAAHQNPHALRLFVADLLGLPAHRFHVRTADVGGSFGQKAYISREDVAVCAAGMLLGRPVKWIEDRVENLQAAGQAREERFDVEAAYDDDGTVRAVRVDMVFDQGAYQLTNLAADDLPDHRARAVPRRVPAARPRVPRPRRRHQQGDLRRVPRSVGGGDVRARTHARRDRRRRRAATRGRAATATSSPPTSSRPVS